MLNNKRISVLFSAGIALSLPALFAVFNRLTQCPLILPVTNGGGFARRVGFAQAVTSVCPHLANDGMLH